MKKYLAVSIALIAAFLAAAALRWNEPAAHAAGGGGGVPAANGDLNGDGSIDISDPVYLLTNLFLGGPAVVPIDCPPPGQLPVDGPIGNGDVNGDRKIDISDAVYLLSSLFTGGPAPKALQCLPSTSETTLPDTGQTKCYGELEGAWIEEPCESTICTGQDGAYATGCPMDGRFVDNGDGTVTDTCTGLMWQKDTADVDRDGQIGDGDRLDWQGALKYCESLVFAGHDDWRLPNVRELQSIVDYGRSNPAIDPIFRAESGGYWSSSTGIEDPRRLAWLVNFAVGNVYGSNDGKVFPIFVRAVRGESLLPSTGQTKCYDSAPLSGDEIDCASTDFPGQDGSYQSGCPNEGRFVDNGDGTVTDTCTGLMWQKDTADVNGDGQVLDDGSDHANWCDALAYCENLSFAGHVDWRLPNVRELQSIVDYGRFNPSIGPVFGAFSFSYWSSTSFASFPRAAWLVSFDGGFVNDDEAGQGGNKSSPGFVRAVRNAP